MTIKEPQLLELDVFISPDDLWPVPPNDELLLETVASYLQKRGEVDDMIEPWLTIHPTEGVLLHWHNEDTSLIVMKLMIHMCRESTHVLFAYTCPLGMRRKTVPVVHLITLRTVSCVLGIMHMKTRSCPSQIALLGQWME